MKQYKEAIPELELAVKRNYSLFNLYYLGIGLAALGEKDKAKEVLEKMKPLNQNQSVGYFETGVLYATLGDFDLAYQCFEKAIEKHEGNVLFLKYNIWYYTNLKQDSRTKQLMDKIGLPY